MKGTSNVLATPATAALRRQRELLLFLDESASLQEQALDAGNLIELINLSERHAAAVRAAAEYVPPAVAWHPELEDMTVQIRDRAESLQHAIRDCMVMVRKELVALTEQERLTDYVAPNTTRQGATWHG